MKREPQQYIKLEDHEAGMDDCYQRERKAVAAANERTASQMKQSFANGYQKGVSDAWTDALGLLRRLSLKDAAAQAQAAIAKKSGKP